MSDFRSASLNWGCLSWLNTKIQHYLCKLEQYDMFCSMTCFEFGVIGQKGSSWLHETQVSISKLHVVMWMRGRPLVTLSQALCKQNRDFSQMITYKLYSDIQIIYSVH